MSSSTQIKSQGPGRPKDMEKRAAILAAAKALFIRNAFAGTSMDAIAADAGVSKLTVYSHFGDKDNLFREVIRSRIQDLLPEETYSFDPKTDIREVLMRVALTHAHLDCNAETVGTFRAILSDCRQGNPRYGKLMWEEGATRTHGLMERLLQQAVDAGRLDIDDVPRASVQFLTLIKGNLMMRQMFGCTGCTDNYVEEIEATARAGVETFLRAYLPR
ncbi:TetR family transcriptional regulator [Rhodanobacter sp. FW510-R12]|uniref:TetR/AcrR family transcriptional regulator n=1 Tax=unclassified Rhodanobacter TaxID=2621553 RepID=UPI0007A9DA4C|nr:MULTISPECIES: TetR/AcrR family transcriptional regulator [unclassified Rhodanobacter]KZC18015.1 TetR family transcriptional regulator [Rhodanobacter sp. FW104-R8]KZC28151.1 TetR family transcriptional regulator [Rhodanobacter sp. FW510-T8]KZC33351.1 TetR family transcriptional regulator [Rhodanobacter sp. FW510-R10]